MHFWNIIVIVPGMLGFLFDVQQEMSVTSGSAIEQQACN